MRKTKFVKDAKLDPGRYYRNPIDVIRDRRLNMEERLEIVTAWELDTKQLLASSAAAPESKAEEKLLQLQKLRVELEREVESAGTAPKQD